MLTWIKFHFLIWAKDEKSYSLLLPNINVSSFYYFILNLTFNSADLRKINILS